MAQGLGITVNATYALVIATIAVMVYLYTKIKKPEGKKNFAIGATIFSILFLLASGAITSGDVQADNVPAAQGLVYSWQEDYAREATTTLTNYVGDTENTDYYDYNDAEIAAIAEKIASEATGAKDAMAKTLAYVFDKVDYTWSEPDSACFGGSAPEILDSGVGQCDTQSMVVISILRKMGIAAKPVGGCLYPTTGCRLESIFPLNAPKYNDLDQVDANADAFSRADIASRKGGLHAWVTAWDPEEGWITLESTTGLIADTKCWNYHVELYVQDENKDDLCVSKSYKYAQGCQLNDLQQLNNYGLGLASEVSP